MYSNTIINKPIPLNELKEELNYTNTETMHNNFVSFISYFIDWFYTNTDFEKEPNKIGRPRYPVDNLLKVVILGFSEGITSGRKIEVNLIFDDRYKTLMNNQRPCYHCINDFKRNSHELIQAVFVYCVKFADYFQFIDLSIIAIDGSKIRANASKYKILKMEDIHFLQYMFKKEEIQNYISKIESASTKTQKEELIKEAEKYLIEYKKEMNKNKSKQEQKTRKGCINFFTNSIKSITKYTNALMELDEMEQLLTQSGQTSISTTDNEALWMKNKKGGIDFNYNVQTVNDTETGLILDIDVIRDPIDLNSLIPEIKNVQRTLNITLENTTILADNGYYSQYTLDYLEKHNLKALIPNRTQSMKVKPKNKENKKYGKINFKYNQGKDTYTCPNNKTLPFQKQYTIKNTTRKVYYTKQCKNCPDQKECAKNNNYRVITNYTSQSRKNMEERFEDPKERETYKKRSTVEIVFGNLIKNVPYTQTNAYGLQNVKTELTLLIIATNLKKIFHKITQK